MIPKKVQKYESIMVICLPVDSLLAYPQKYQALTVVQYF